MLSGTTATHSQPSSTTVRRDSQPTTSFHDSERGPGTPTPVLGSKPYDQGLPHVPAVPETCIDNSRWVTLCGWNYGTSLYRKQLYKPTTNYCIKCSFLASHQEMDNDSEDDI